MLKTYDRGYSWLSSFTKVENTGDIAFEDNSKGKIIRVGSVCLVDNLRHNLISISQLCDKVTYYLW